MGQHSSALAGARIRKMIDFRCGRTGADRATSASDRAGWGHPRRFGIRERGENQQAERNPRSEAFKCVSETPNAKGSAAGSAMTAAPSNADVTKVNREASAQAIRMSAFVYER